MKNILPLSLSDVVFIMLINVKMPTMSMINFVLSQVEHEKSFYNLRAWPASSINLSGSCIFHAVLTAPLENSMSKPEAFSLSQNEV